ncbi:adenylate/guanylate cyclase domain-containing protein [Sneathiella marina]|uniref:Adenylate/guanylate cyclase domain-containing protein n=1 Tax=Sneathiella marina TaxID=2950108 RepID=A0ABY4W5J0_9PROT|nr:adenylate/guanylate cyclase domain-containing protein [Sneathiella marina]USG62457.1 adenylate/guanylate cyclase domain-containing protein [Sneathiella marina]
MHSYINRAMIWLTTAPSNVPKDMVRYHVYWKIFYLIAALGHAMTLQMFYQTGVYFMAVFNIASIFIFVVALLLLNKGFYRTAFWGAIIELVAHGIAATICVGNDYGFQNFAFLVVVLLFVQPFYKLRISIFFASIVLTTAASVMFYSVHNPPIYTVPPEWADTMVISSMFSWPIYVMIMVLPFIRASARAEEEIATAYGESERLLLNILPAPIAERLKFSDDMIADDHDKVAVLFADIVGFTQMSDRLAPAELVKLLNKVFNQIDKLVVKYGVEKIKTIGDAYMIVAGVPNPDPNPEKTMAELALEMKNVVSQFKDPVTGDALQLRIGINTGSVVAGVIGNKKFAYDLWGDAVNIAARMEATSEVGHIQVTDEFASSLKDQFIFEPRGSVDIKGKGKMKTFYLKALTV